MLGGITGVVVDVCRPALICSGNFGDDTTRKYEVTFKEDDFLEVLRILRKSGAIGFIGASVMVTDFPHKFYVSSALCNDGSCVFFSSPNCIHVNESIIVGYRCKVKKLR